MARVSKSLPLQVAAVCFRRRGPVVEFLLVNTNGGNKWTFPKGCVDAHLSHSQSAEREAAEEAGFRACRRCRGGFRASARRPSAATASWIARLIPTPPTGDIA